jgi:uncharacterized protein (TIGR03118 family)
MMMHRGVRSMVFGFFCLAVWAPGTVFAGSSYFQTTLITSASDPDLINPWGISSSAGSPFWVSDNGTGKSTLYNGLGVKQGLVVTMPNNDPITGQVFNGTSNFNGSAFVFASENGTIDGWRGALGTNAEQLFSVADAVYKGLAIATTHDLLYGANFHSGAIDVFNSGGLTGSFSDPNAPAGYAPFNIQNLGGKFFVTFAKQDGAKHDDVAGAGNGFVDIFDPVSHTFTRLITGSAVGTGTAPLNSPWGVSLAPSTFGPLGGALLVGNFGDGTINGFDPTTGTLLGTMRDPQGNPIVNPGLWGLQFGNNNATFDPNALYFTAGGADEGSGIFARINSVPEPSSLILGLFAAGGIAFARWGTKRKGAGTTCAIG